mmetsp:Transcript_14804/g.34893  ORF Transcript_14804/g.34893 Transcript_14804/m.34893 type:complete len:656 (-) Transcript_14804:80-2047(-)
MEVAVRQDDDLLLRPLRERNAESVKVVDLGVNIPAKPLAEEKNGIWLPLAGPQSTNPRKIEIITEDGSERFSFGAVDNTTVEEVKNLLAQVARCDPGKIDLGCKAGNYFRKLWTGDVCPSLAWTIGMKSFKPKKHKFKHPLCIIGGGLGGLWTMKRLLERGNDDFVVFERHADFGGHSWISVANKFTKLQTEKGTYFFDYIVSDAKCPDYIGDMKYKTWPTRDQLLTMMRVGARELNLDQKAYFNTRVERIKPKGTVQKEKTYACHYVPEDPDEDGGIFLAGAVIAWPGNLCEFNKVDWQGEEDFGGYIEYCSFDKVDYEQATGKDVMLFGHGAFTIENVRTLVEHRCKKVYVVCRKRNLAGMKMASWMVGYLETPVPGNILLDVFQEMYDLVGFDVWTAHSVQTDAKHSFAQINSKTVFGVTDVYFLAGYYGLMEVIVDGVKRLSKGTVHLKGGRKLEVEMIVKACGTNGSYKIDRMLGLKELVGYWVNEDPFMPVSCNGMFVQARNFGSFSSGPGFAGQIPPLLWFLEYPDDFEPLRGNLPRRKPDARPGYCPDVDHLMPTGMAIGRFGPGALQLEMHEMNMLKARSQQRTHPLPTFLAECKAEWDNYIKYFRENKMVDDRPDPPYPYTLPKMEAFMERCAEAAEKAMKRMQR